MTGGNSWVVPAVGLCALLVAGCAADGGGDDDGSGAPGPKEDRADRVPAGPIALDESSIAAYEVGRDRLYVASDDAVARIELPDGTAAAHFTAGGPVVALEVTERELLVLAAIDGDQLRLTRVGHDGSVGDEITFATTMLTTVPRPALRLLDPETVVVIDDRGDTEVVIDVDTGDVHASDPGVHMFVYQAPGLGVLDGHAFLPSAYPGEVVEAAASSDHGLVEVRRIQVSDDWLHDVAMIDADRAVVAGHLQGIGVVEMVETEPFEGAPYTPISDLLFAYSVVGEGLAYSAAGSTLVCIAVDDLTGWTVEIPGFEEMNIPDELHLTKPLGERAPGRVLLHQPGTGIVEIDCAAAAR